MKSDPVYAVGDTLEDAEREIRAAITVHLDELAESGEPAPQALSAAGTVTVQRHGHRRLGAGLAIDARGLVAGPIQAAG